MRSLLKTLYMLLATTLVLPALPLEKKPMSDYEVQLKSLSPYRQLYQFSLTKETNAGSSLLAIFNEEMKAIQFNYHSEKNSFKTRLYLDENENLSNVYNYYPDQSRSVSYYFTPVNRKLLKLKSVLWHEGDNIYREVYDFEEDSHLEESLVTRSWLFHNGEIHTYNRFFYQGDHLAKVETYNKNHEEILTRHYQFIAGGETKLRITSSEGRVLNQLTYTEGASNELRVTPLVEENILNDAENRTSVNTWSKTLNKQISAKTIYEKPEEEQFPFEINPNPLDGLLLFERERFGLGEHRAYNNLLTDEKHYQTTLRNPAGNIYKNMEWIIASNKNNSSLSVSQYLSYMQDIYYHSISDAYWQIRIKQIYNQNNKPLGKYSYTYDRFGRVVEENYQGQKEKYATSIRYFYKLPNPIRGLSNALEPGKTLFFLTGDSLYNAIHRAATLKKKELYLPSRNSTIKYYQQSLGYLFENQMNKVIFFNYRDEITHYVRIESVVTNDELHVSFKHYRPNLEFYFSQSPDGDYYRDNPNININEMAAYGESSGMLKEFLTKANDNFPPPESGRELLQTVYDFRFDIINSVPLYASRKVYDRNNVLIADETIDRGRVEKSPLSLSYEKKMETYINERNQQLD